MIIHVIKILHLPKKLLVNSGEAISCCKVYEYL